MGEMVNEGIQAPRFSLLDHRGATSSTESLAGNWYLMYWYPKANTPGCTAQATGLRDQLEAFQDLGCRVLGASFDPVDDLVVFAAQHSLNFALLSDGDRSTGSAFGVAGPDRTAAHAERVAFLVDPDGIVRRRYDVEDPEFFAESVLDDLEKLLS